MRKYLHANVNETETAQHNRRTPLPVLLIWEGRERERDESFTIEISERGAFLDSEASPINKISEPQQFRPQRGRLNEEEEEEEERLSYIGS